MRMGCVIRSDQIRSAGVRSGKEGHGDRGTGNDEMMMRM